ncbi:single-stranded DNA-binding protein [Allobranchiibius sp. CTAmp26]|uniref:single-stranded DNA-binding protein n=1 Tax=Allobranchiibius sp. CTAmp26 TaxID=2815214 RepID=UPI001AA100FB|nr:single-stranded DNA-binding protein [Allobranchiibius sp. CTAmp26]MBO1755990.1 single-stranded DNA-binding protein [Allobranchiibius sp. CTAmp26]
MNEVEITLTGNVSLDPQRHQTRSGDNFLSFRVAVNERRYDQASGGYIDGTASSYRVVAWKQLGRHLHGCLRKGDPVIVRGVLRINEWTATNGQARSTPEVTAYHVGHDLAFGEGSFRRVSRSAPTGVSPVGREAEASEAVPPAAGTDDDGSGGSQSAA